VPLSIRFFILMFLAAFWLNGQSVEPGKRRFDALCAGCHGADGTGNTPAGKSLKVRDLHLSDVQGQSDAQLLNTISNGKGKMPGEGERTAEKVRWNFVSLVRSFAKKGAGEKAKSESSQN